MNARIRTAARSVGFAGSFAALLGGWLLRERVGALHHESLTSHDDERAVWLRRWCRSQFALFDIRPTFVGDAPYARSNGSTAPGRLVVANHRSAIDIILLLNVFGGYVISRADLATWPLLGRGAREFGTVFVDRADPKSGAKTIRTISDRLKQGHTICLFPEGTTFEGDEVRPFHGGAFLAAKDAGADIVPVGIAYGTGSQAAYVGTTFVQHLARVAASSAPTKVGVVIGDPVKAQGPRGQLGKTMHEEVSRLVTKAREIVDGPGASRPG
ncbi:MAG: lysophospholipid acyltransferase family protein [Polyangiaceae bacterium]